MREQLAESSEQTRVKGRQSCFDAGCVAGTHKCDGLLAQASFNQRVRAVRNTFPDDNPAPRFRDDDK